MQSFFTVFHMSSRNATWFYSEISIKHHPFDHKKLELAFHFDIFQCFSENSWDNICQPNCFIDYLPKWQSKFTNKRDTRNPKPIYIYISGLIQLTICVNVIDLYSCHVISPSSLSRLLRMVSCSFYNAIKKIINYHF